MEKEMKDYIKNKNKILNKKFNIIRKPTNKTEKNMDINFVTFGEEFEIIKKIIVGDIEE
jgi:hypothetical protein